MNQKRQLEVLVRHDGIETVAVFPTILATRSDQLDMVVFSFHDGHGSCSVGWVTQKTTNVEGEPRTQFLKQLAKVYDEYELIDAYTIEESHNESRRNQLQRT